jgi:hypothetical protein
VIYNATATNVPVFNPLPATYNGLFYESSGAELGRAGAITLSTTISGSYSGKLQIGPTSYSFGGTFASDGGATNTIVRKGASQLILILNLDGTDENSVIGTVGDGSFVADLRATRAAADADISGPYTLIFNGVNGDAQLPAGDGNGTATVDATGKIKFSGSLADGTKVSQSAATSANGEWPLYISLYSGKGQLLGWLVFTNSGQNLSGDVNWIKSQIAKAKFYPNGFNFDTQVTGSAYDPKMNPLIGFTNGVVILTGGNLTAAITNNVTVTGANVMNLNNNKLTFKLSASRGTITGSVVNPVGGATVPFTGVFLQGQNFGSGYSLGTNQSANLFFGPAN